MGINKDSQKVPNLRFKGFTDDWEQRKLGSIYQFQYGQFNNNPDNGGIYPIYGANGIIGGYHGYNADNSVVIGHMGAYAGHVLWAEGKHFVTYNGTIGFPKDLNFDRKFGFHMLQHINIPKITAGSGQPFVSYADLKNIKVHISDSIDEQNKLGNFFDMLENTITLHQRKLDQLNQLKEALLQQMFPGKGETVPKLRFAGFEGDWEERKLGEIAPLRGGFAFKSSEFQEEGIPIVRISNILTTGEVGGDFIYYPEQVKDDNYLLPDRSVVLAMSGATTGKVSILSNPNDGKVYQNQRVGYFTKTKIADYGFISTITQSQIFIEQLRAMLVAGAQPNISSKDIDMMDFTVPKNLEEQTKIGAFFQGFVNLITLQQRKLDQLKITKQILLENMFI